MTAQCCTSATLNPKNPEPLKPEKLKVLLQGDPVAQYTARMRALFQGPGKKRETPMLWGDVYRGRALSLAQRLFTGAVPVLENDPSVTIDDLGGCAQLVSGEKFTCQRGNPCTHGNMPVGGLLDMRTCWAVISSTTCFHLAHPI